jgi:outer membrane autotransporter protein
MRRYLLTSCASSLVLALLAGESALGQQVYNGTQNVSQQIGDGATPTQVQVNGGSSVQVQLSNTANSYSGGTVVTGGSTVAVDSDSELGKSSGALTLGDSSSSGTLKLLNTQGTSIVSSRSIILNSGGGTINANGNGYTSGTLPSAFFSGPISGGGALTLSGGDVHLSGGANSFAGGVTINGGATLFVNSDQQLGTAGGAITLGDTSLSGGLAVQSSNFTSARTINVNGGGGVLYNLGGGVATFSGVVQGTGLLSVGGGTVSLTNTNNSWIGGTSVTGGGTLQINADSTLGNQAQTSVYLGDAATHGTLQLTGNTAAITTGREILLGAGGGTLLNTSGYGWSISGILTDAVSGSPGSLTISGNGSSPISLTGTNSFTGNITVTKGAILGINSDYALGGYSITTNALTGFASYNLNATPNTLILQQGTVQFTAGTTVQHPITLDGGGTIDSGGNTVTVNTNISQTSTGAASLNVTNSSATSAGVLVLDGINSYTGGTNVGGGTQTATLIIGDTSHPTASLTGNVTVGSAGIVSGAGTIAGALINQGGTVAPASVLQASSYVQTSGTLAPIIGPDTAQYGAGGKALLDVGSGSAAINGGYLAPSFAPGLLRAGKYLIFSAGSLSGAGFTAESLNIPSIGMAAQIVQQGDQFFVVLSQLPSLPAYDKPTIVPVLTGAALDEGQQALGTLLDRLAGVRTNALADELSVAFTDYHRVRGTSPYGVWVMPLGNNGTVSGSNGGVGYNATGAGLMAGIDTQWMPGVSIGAALGYTNNFIKQGDGNAGTISMPRLAVYGGWWRGPFAIDAVIGVGMGQVDASRPVPAPGFYQTAYSNHVANERSAALQASAAWAFDGWVVGPAAGVKYLNVHQTGFTETGTNLYNFSVNDQWANSLRPFGNVLLSKRFMVSDHWALVPEFKVGIEHEIASGVKRVTVQTEGDAYDWTYNGLVTGSDLLRLDGGVKLETSRSSAFFVDYNHLQSSSTISEYVSGGFRYRL